MTYISTYHQNPSKNMMPIVKPHCSITLLLQIRDVGQQGTDRNHQETQTYCSIVKYYTTHNGENCKCLTALIQSNTPHIQFHLVFQRVFVHSVIEYTIFVLRSEFYLEFTTTCENLSHTNSTSGDFFFSLVVLCNS